MVLVPPRSLIADGDGQSVKKAIREKQGLSYPDHVTPDIHKSLLVSGEDSWGAVVTITDARGLREDEFTNSDSENRDINLHEFLAFSIQNFEDLKQRNIPTKIQSTDEVPEDKILVGGYRTRSNQIFISFTDVSSPTDRVMPIFFRSIVTEKH